MPKVITDREVLQQIAAILESTTTYKAKYEALDLLWFAVTNYHPQGMAAKVLESVSVAQRWALIQEQKGGGA